MQHTQPKMAEAGRKAKDGWLIVTFCCADKEKDGWQIYYYVGSADAVVTTEEMATLAWKNWVARWHELHERFERSLDQYRP